MNSNQSTYFINNKETFNNRVFERNLQTYQIQQTPIIPLNFSENYVTNRKDTITSFPQPMDIYNHGTGNRMAGFVNFSVPTQTRKTTNSMTMNTFNK
jgi:hypothetical protein